MNWTISALCYFYFVFVGISYLLGFWTPLHFNILEFLSPIDMIKSATYPVIPAALGMFFFVLVDTYNSQGTKKPESDDPKYLKYIFWAIIFIFLLLILINVINMAVQLYSLFVAEPEKRLSYALPILSILSVVYFLYNPPFLINKHKFLRHFVIIFMCMLPTVSYFQGNKNITKILKGTSSYHYLKSSSKSCFIDEKSRMIYLGFYGGNYFFVNSISKDICVEKGGGVLLSFNDNKAAKPSLDTKKTGLNSNNKIYD